MRRKKERSKQGQTNMYTGSNLTQRQLSFFTGCFGCMHFPCFPIDVMFAAIEAFQFQFIAAVGIVFNVLYMYSYIIYITVLLLIACDTIITLSLSSSSHSENLTHSNHHSTLHWLTHSNHHSTLHWLTHSNHHSTLHWLTHSNHHSTLHWLTHSNHHSTLHWLTHSNHHSTLHWLTHSNHHSTLGLPGVVLKGHIPLSLSLSLSITLHHSYIFTLSMHSLTILLHVYTEL